MKLGTQTASVHNHLYSRMVIGQPEPTPGMGATILCWTDRHGATIESVEKKNGTTFITVRRDRATRADKNGMSECQTWAFERDPTGPAYTYRMAKGGRWEEVWFNAETKRWNKCEGGGQGLRIGERSEYYDFSF